MDEQDIRRIIKEEIAKNKELSQYSVNRVPVHTHNNIDSPNLQQHSVVGFQSLPGTGTGVASPPFLNGQAIAFNDYLVSTAFPQYTNFYSYPLPIIYGYGTTSTDTVTGAPSAGDTSATLTGAWGGTTGTYAVQFGNDEVRNVLFTNGSTTISWTPPLTGNTGSATITIIAGARFHGGDAPPGTAIIFRNDDDGIIQLWVKTVPQVTLFTWAGVDLGGTGLVIYT